MLEYFRKYSMVAFIVLILLFFGLIFMVDGIGGSGMGTGPKMLSYKGRAYTQSQVERQGQDYGSLFISLLEPGRTSAFSDLLPYAQLMKISPQGFQPRDYLANRLLLGDLMDEYGVKPGQEQIESFVTDTIFADQNGEFNEQGYLDFINKRVKRLGLGVQDFNDLMAEIIAASKLKDIIGTGYSIDEDLNRKTIKINQQEITYEQFTLPMANLKDSIQVSDEEIKAFWEESKNNYLTDVQIKVQYATSDAGLETIHAIALEGEKAKAKAAGKSEEEIEKVTHTLDPTYKNKVINVAGDKIDSLFVNLQDAEGKDFVAKAEEIGLITKTTEFFTEQTAPYDLKLPLYQAAGSAVQSLMNLTEAGESMASLSDVLPIGEGRYLIAQVLERKEAEPLPFEEVKERAKLDLIDDKAKNSIKEEVEKISEQLQNGIGGKSSSELAKELNLEYVKHDDASLSKPISGEVSSRDFFTAATQLENNIFSEPIIQTEAGQNRAVILRPLSRKYLNSEENAASVESQLSTTDEMIGNVVFENWFNNKLSQVAIETF